ncbi:hypothetical protein CBR_g21210 [Chara braunii]|uniref:Protein kinase domain-containing protein n=1 Tax=Chara braunii TaxID=69332 RepID=A0A388L142_CHABU|nr:hypothetical protein CBR_g21210 [Chara braunii]|eukprot:GBG75968.1 hypothetical protein CBR_g21210 [Chara braunii]
MDVSTQIRDVPCVSSCLRYFSLQCTRSIAYLFLLVMFWRSGSSHAVAKEDVLVYGVMPAVTPVDLPGRWLLSPGRHVLAERSATSRAALSTSAASSPPPSSAASPAASSASLSAASSAPLSTAQFSAVPSTALPSSAVSSALLSSTSSSAPTLSAPLPSAASSATPSSSASLVGPLAAAALAKPLAFTASSALPLSTASSTAPPSSAVPSGALPLSEAPSDAPPSSLASPVLSTPDPEPQSGFVRSNTALLLSSRFVWLHTATPPFLLPDTKKLSCRLSATDLVFPAQSTAFYIMLVEHCFTQGDVTHHRYSLWKADLAQADHDASGLGHEELLSYWWPYVEGSGSAEKTPFIQYAGANDTLLMAAVYAMVLTRTEESLIVLSNPSVNPEFTYSTISTLSTTNGNRSSKSLTVSTAVSLTFNPNKTKLYITQGVGPSRILSTPVQESGMPIDGAQWQEVKTFSPGDDQDIKSIAFSSQSFVSDERCLYFLDIENVRVWGIDPLASNTTNPVLVAGSGLRGLVDKDGLNSSFNNLTDIAATPDGCNVFVIDYYYGVLRWLQLDSPCSLARRVTTVASYSELQTLRLRQSGDDYCLYVGANDGSVTELKINVSHLHSCAPQPPSSGGDSPSSSNANGPASASSPPTSASPSGEPSGPKTTPRGPRNLALTVVIPLSLLAFLGLAACTSFLIFRKSRRDREEEQPKIISRTNGSANTVATTVSLSGLAGFAGGGGFVGGGEGLHPSQVKQFSLEALSFCTRNFSECYRIGQGGAFGNVYWGSKDGDNELAIKVMTGNLTAEKRSMFVAEVNTLSRVHHANLIRLVGYCHEGNRSMLVYPYFPGGSLFARLHEREKAVPGKPSIPPLTLVERMCIALQIAKGLAYLHEGADPPVIHRDIKSSNVLLGDGSGEKLHVVVADFGLATMGERVFGTQRETVVKSLQMAGTFGYMAPEYMMGGILSEKNDVYAFGVILLELLTGRRAVAKAPSGVGWEALADWAKPLLKRVSVGVEIPYQILDPCLRDQAAGFRFSRMVAGALHLASECLREDDQARPAMCGLVEKIGNLLNEAHR